MFDVRSEQTVAIISTRELAHGDAEAVATALRARAGWNPLIVDGLLQPRSASGKLSRPPSEQSTSAKLGMKGLTIGARKLLLSNEIMRNAMLARGVFRDRERAAGLIHNQKPAAIVIFDDRRVRPDRVAIEKARNAGIASVLVPYAVSTLESDLFIRRKRAELMVGRSPWRTLKARISSRLPNQIGGTVDSPGMTFYTPLETLLLDRMGLLPEHPWVWGGGGADRVCALGMHHRDYLMAGGVDPTRIAVTGQPSLDQLALNPAAHDIRRRQFTSRYGLDPSRPIILCAVPQHGEHGLTDWVTHWKLTEELFAQLARSGGNVLLSLHPKSKRGDYQRRAADKQLPILDERLIEALPIADLLVGTFSSTIGWATGLGIPAIVIDSLASDYTLYRNVPGVSVVASNWQAGDLIEQCCKSPQTRATFVAAARRGQSLYGSIDGCNAARVTDVIIAAVHERSTKAKTGGKLPS